jgi:hypothetical protein
MRSGRSPLASLLYWLFMVALCIVFAEVAVRLWGLSPRYSLKAKGLDYALPFVLDEELLYRFLPEPACSINTQGFRDHEFPAKSPDKKRLVVLQQKKESLFCFRSKVKQVHYI